MSLSLTDGPVRRTLIKFSVPIMLSMMVAQLYSIVDSAIVGKLLDVHMLAAVSNGYTVLMVFLFVSGGMELATNLIVASKMPVSTKEEMSVQVYNLLFIDFLLGILLGVLGLLTYSFWLRLIHTPEEILSAATLYGRIFMVGLPFSMVFMSGQEALIGTGDSGTPMHIALFTTILNIFLDVPMIWKFGVGGAAFASVFSECLGMALIVRRLRQKVLVGPFHLSLLSPDCFRDILRLAPPNMVQQMSGMIVSMIKQSLLGFLGTTCIAGYGCAEKVIYLLMLVEYGFMQGLVTFTAQNLAAGHRDRIHKAEKELYKILVVYLLFMVLLCRLGRFGFLRLFTDDQEAVRYGALILLFEPLTYFVSTISQVQMAILRGYQKMNQYLVASIGGMAINIGITVLLVNRLGFSGFYIAMYISCIPAMLLAIGMRHLGTRPA